MIYSGKARLSDHDLGALERCFHQHFLTNDRLWIFGSRADLNKKSGDIDLYIETYASTVNDAMDMQSRFLYDFEQNIGEQKIDVVLNLMNIPYPMPIHDIAKTKGIRII